LARRDDTEEEPNEESIEVKPKHARANPKVEDTIGAQVCSLCGITFYTVEDQRSHIRSDLHGYNLKQRLRGAKPVSEVDFEKLVGGEVYSFDLSEYQLTFPRPRRESFRL
jgi:hypothetical protein